MASHGNTVTGVPLDPVATPPLNPEDPGRDRLEYGVEHLNIDGDANPDDLQPEDEGAHIPSVDAEDAEYDSDPTSLFLPHNRPIAEEDDEEGVGDGVKDAEGKNEKAEDEEAGDAEAGDGDKKKRSPRTARLGSPEKKKKSTFPHRQG